MYNLRNFCMMNKFLMKAISFFSCFQARNSVGQWRSRIKVAQKSLLGQMQSKYVHYFQRWNMCADRQTDERMNWNDFLMVLSFLHFLQTTHNNGPVVMKSCSMEYVKEYVFWDPRHILKFFWVLRRHQISLVSPTFLW